MHLRRVPLMAHPDYQYTPKLIPAMVSLIGNGPYPCVRVSPDCSGDEAREALSNPRFECWPCVVTNLSPRRLVGVPVEKCGPTVLLWLGHSVDRLGVRDRIDKRSSWNERTMIRSFIAIELPEGIRHALAEVQKHLKRDVAGVRWVQPASIHLTLKFLGDIPAEQVQPIAAAAMGVVQNEPPLIVGLGGLGAFPNPRRPRVVWVGIEGDVERMGRVQTRLEEALEPLGVPREGRAFRPHLTLGRVKDPRRPPDLTRALADVTVPTCNSFDVHEILLYKSDLRPTGAIYTKLQHLPFAGSAGS